MNTSKVKSREAFQATLKRQAGGSLWCYLWTFTRKEFTEVKELGRHWNSLRTVLVREDGMQGVRVFEQHPGGHGGHVHVITMKRHDVNKVRQLVEGTEGWGRLHVKRVPVAKMDYVIKYLGKAFMIGIRSWGVFGGRGVPRVRSSDVEISSPVSREMKHITCDELDDTFKRKVGYFANEATGRQRCYYRYVLAFYRVNDSQLRWR
jgi:hypothetical protein